MSESVDDLPVGPALPDWKPCAPPSREPMVGCYCRLEPLDPARHAQALHTANQYGKAGRNWTYLSYGPFESLDAYRAWVGEVSRSDDPLFYAILNAEGTPVGVASYLRIEPAIGSIEVGHINFSPLIQRRREATEAIYLMMVRAFDELGYRRYEWKCDALNAGSRRAAERFGFAYEGTFRQALIYKGRNRDTAWYSIIDAEWPAIRAAIQSWLDPANFDGEGNQRSRLRVQSRIV